MEYKKLLELQSINEYNSEEQLNILKYLFDLSLDSKNMFGIDLGLTLSKQIDKNVLSDNETVLFHYFVANGWSTKRLLKAEDESGQWDFQMEEIQNEIFHLRKAISCVGFKSIGILRQCQIYTNLGNTFSFIGRFIEAQQAWTKAIEINPESSITIANKAKGLFYYGKYLYDTVHTNIFLLYSFMLCKQSMINLKSEFKATQNEVKEFYRYLEKIIPVGLRDYLPDLNDFSLGKGNLKKYREWCLRNNFYINPLNDLGYYSKASHDCLNLPAITVQLDQPPSWLNLYNQMKQEFGTARFLLYESLNEKKAHYSDQDIVLINTYENAQYSFSLEKTKMSFRMCYSIFDKIAFLLNDYLKLNIDKDRINFKNLWVVNSGKQKKQLKEFFLTSNNWALRGLYWLSKDIFEKDDDFDTVIEPEAKELNILRNHVEHKALKIVSNSIDLSSVYDEDKDLAYVITRQEFEKRVLKLFALVRSAIMYLSLAINQEEKKKENKNAPVLPIIMAEIPHDNKR